MPWASQLRAEQSEGKVKVERDSYYDQERSKEVPN